MSDAAERARKRPWRNYPQRLCNSMHECELCGETIRLGDSYADGGYRRRAHRRCWTALPDVTQEPDS